MVVWVAQLIILSHLTWVEVELDCDKIVANFDSDTFHLSLNQLAISIITDGFNLFIISLVA